MNIIKIPTEKFPNCEVMWHYIDGSTGLRPHYKFWVRNGEERFPWMRLDAGPQYPVGAGQLTLEEVEKDARGWIAQQEASWERYLSLPK
jgi:hypothetical protein